MRQQDGNTRQLNRYHELQELKGNSKGEGFEFEIPRNTKTRANISGTNCLSYDLKIFIYSV